MSKYTQIPELGVSKADDHLILKVENIKCGGCENTITKSLTALGLKELQVNHETNEVEFKDPANDELVLEVLEKLRNLGYPLVDSEEGLTKLALKAKSFTSCAIGKMTK